MWGLSVTLQTFKIHQWCFQANSSCHWVSGWHFKTTTIYILSRFWASGICLGNVTISITESVTRCTRSYGSSSRGLCCGEQGGSMSCLRLRLLHTFCPCLFGSLSDNFPVGSLVFSSCILIQAIAHNSFLHLLFSFPSSSYLWIWGRCISRWRCSHCGGTGQEPTPCRTKGHLQTLPSTGRVAERHLGTNTRVEGFGGWEREMEWRRRKSRKIKWKKALWTNSKKSMTWRKPLVHKSYVISVVLFRTQNELRALKSTL